MIQSLRNSETLFKAQRLDHAARNCHCADLRPTGLVKARPTIHRRSIAAVLKARLGEKRHQTRYRRMRVIITGAAGEIGSQLVQELSGIHELCLIDQRPVPGRASIIGDLSTRYGRTHWRHWWKSSGHPRWVEGFKNADVVVHLALDQRPEVAEDQLLLNNINITANVIEAAALNRVSRVVFASSNWAVKALEHEMAPSCYVSDGPKIGSDAPPRPITSYGLAKAFGEISGRMAVDRGQLGSFVAVRIGSFLTVCPQDERRHRWVGVQDMRNLLRYCVEAEFSGFHVVYGVSAQPSVPYDLSHTRELLRWQPQQHP